jgi:hypothetical protein
MSLARYIARGLTLTVAALVLGWAIQVLPTSEAADQYRYLENQLLHSENFSSTTFGQQLAYVASQTLADCDTHSQTAIALMEMRLAEIALHSGKVDEFDRLSSSLEARSRRVLNCAPRESFIWLLAFSLEILHGRMTEETFSLLAMSYETSPSEGWIAIRRNFVGTPLLLVMPVALQDSFLQEFGRLVSNGFQHEAALSYSAASLPIRSYLRTQVEQLDSFQQQRFWDAFRKIQS